MSFNVSSFTDPAMRPYLQQFYENKKAAAVEAWKAREELPSEVKMRNPDGSISTAKLIPISAEAMEMAFVSFDKWLDLTAQIYDTNSRCLEMAQKHVDDLAAHSPDSSSGVAATFSSNGVLLAYTNEDGTLVTSNGAETFLGSVQQKADELGLSGQSRVDYINREVGKILAEKYRDLSVTSYESGASPTLRDFAKAWYHNYDADQMYNDAMAEAKAHLESVTAWHKQFQANLNEMQAFLLSMQEAA